jgi:hypothetical protein
MNRRGYAVVLGILASAFLLRVLGQVIVAVREVSWLPPMQEWYSGLMPYPLLLPVQLVILAGQAMISRDIWRGSGFFARHRPKMGRGLQWFSYVYFAGMVLRYVLTMTHHPERRWFSGTIPIFFHCVLAAYLFVLGRFSSSETSTSAEENLP